MSSHPRKDTLIAEVAADARARQRAVDALDDVAADALHVNRTDLRCLDLLVDRGTATPGDIAEALRLTTGSVTPLIDRLEHKGYVRREPAPDDRRSVTVVPTRKLLQVAADLYGPIAAEGAELLARYSAAELQLLLDYSHRDRELQERHAERIRSAHRKQGRKAQ